MVGGGTPVPSIGCHCLIKAGESMATPNHGSATGLKLGGQNHIELKSELKCDINLEIYKKLSKIGYMLLSTKNAIGC